jgi:DNA adenine methylase
VRLLVLIGLRSCWAAGALSRFDPPYWGCEDDYGKAVFERADFERLAEALAGLKGRFILSINDVPEIRRTFRSFAVEEVETTYTISKGAAQAGRKELVFSSSREQGR